MGGCCSSKISAIRNKTQSSHEDNVEISDINNNNSNNNNNTCGVIKCTNSLEYIDGNTANSNYHKAEHDEKSCIMKDNNATTSRRSAYTKSNTSSQSLFEEHKSCSNSNDFQITNTEGSRWDDTNSLAQRSNKENGQNNDVANKLGTYYEDTFSPMIVESELAQHQEQHHSCHNVSISNKEQKQSNDDSNIHWKTTPQLKLDTKNVEIPLLVRSSELAATHLRRLSNSTSCLERSIMLMEDLITDTMQVSASSTTENPHSITNSYKHMYNDDLLTISSLVDVSQPTYTYSSRNSINNNNNYNNNKDSVVNNINVNYNYNTDYAAVRNSVNINERGHMRTLSDIDPTSDFDFTLVEQTDTPRLTYAQRERERHLFSSEVDGRSRILRLYYLARKALIINFCKEQFTVERLKMLQKFFLERSDLLLRIHVIDEAVQRRRTEVEWKRTLKLAIEKFITECQVEQISGETTSETASANEKITEVSNQDCTLRQKPTSTDAHTITINSKLNNKPISNSSLTMPISASEENNNKINDNDNGNNNEKNLTKHIEHENNVYALQSSPSLQHNTELKSTKHRAKKHTSKSESLNSSLENLSSQKSEFLAQFSSRSLSSLSSSSLSSPSSESSSMWSAPDVIENNNKSSSNNNKSSTTNNKGSTNNNKSRKMAVNSKSYENKNSNVIYSPPVSSVLELQNFNIPKNLSSIEKMKCSTEKSREIKERSNELDLETQSLYKEVEKEEVYVNDRLLTNLESSSERPSSAPARSSSFTIGAHERSSHRNATAQAAVTNNVDNSNTANEVNNTSHKRKNTNQEHYNQHHHNHNHQQHNNNNNINNNSGSNNSFASSSNYINTTNSLPVTTSISITTSNNNCNNNNNNNNISINSSSCNDNNNNSLMLNRISYSVERSSDCHSPFALPLDNVGFTPNAVHRNRSTSKKSSQSNSGYINKILEQEKMLEESEQYDKEMKMENSYDPPLHAESSEPQLHEEHSKKTNKNNRRKKFNQGANNSLRNEAKLSNTSCSIDNYISEQNEVNNDCDDRSVNEQITHSTHAIVDHTPDTTLTSIQEVPEGNTIERNSPHSVTSHSSQLNHHHHHHHNHNHHHHNNNHQHYNYHYQPNRHNELLPFSDKRNYSVPLNTKREKELCSVQKEREQEYAHLKTESYGAMLSETVYMEGSYSVKR